MAATPFTVVCTSVKTLARDIVEVRFAKPEGFTFVPGQFVLFDVPLVENPSDIQPRAYSIASAPHDEELLFVFKLLEGGRASRWVGEMLKAGDSVTMQRAMGLFRMHPGTAPVAMLCTSTGVAPFYSMLRAQAHEGSQRPVDLLLGVRSEEDRFWVDELASLQDQNPWLRVHWALTQPSSDWQGITGRLQAVAVQVIPDLADRHVLACGNPPMTLAIKQLCLETLGMPKEHVHVEGYI